MSFSDMTMYFLMMLIADSEKKQKSMQQNMERIYVRKLKIF